MELLCSLLGTYLKEHCQTMNKHITAALACLPPLFSFAGGNFFIYWHPRFTFVLDYFIVFYWDIFTEIG